MFNIGIIGCGDMGKQHAAAWKARSDCKIAAVFDPDESRRRELGAATGAAACAEMPDAIAKADVVSVCTPVAFHADAALLAARQRKHILCEKPIALRLAQADAMIAAAKENSVCLAVSFQYRGFSRHIHYRQLVRDGAFGSPIFFRVSDFREVRPKIAMHRRSMNGGPLVDMASHLFDLLRFYTGNKPVRVYAQGHVFGKDKPRLANIDDLAIDAATVEVTTSGGDVGSFFLNWGMPEGFAGGGEEMIVGAKLSAKTVAGGIELTRGRERERLTLPADPPGPTVRIADLIGAIRNEHPLEVSGADGRIALAVSLAALESIETGRAVEIGG